MYLLVFNPISRIRELNTRREVPYLKQPYTIFYYVDTIGLNWQKKFDKRPWEFNGERFAIHSSTWQTGARGEWRVSSWLAISNKRFHTWIPLSVEPKPHILPSDLLWEWRIDLSNPKKRKQHKTNGKKKQNKISGNWSWPTRWQVVSLLYFYSNTLTTSLISSFSEWVMVFSSYLI